MVKNLNFVRRLAPADAGLAALLKDFSIEVMPRNAAKSLDFRAILPAGTRMYLADPHGTDLAGMLATPPGGLAARRARARA